MFFSDRLRVLSDVTLKLTRSHSGHRANMLLMWVITAQQTSFLSLTHQNFCKLGLRLSLLSLFYEWESEEKWISSLCLSSRCILLLISSKQTIVNLSPSMHSHCRDTFPVYSSVLLYTNIIWITNHGYKTIWHQWPKDATTAAKHTWL